VPSIQGLSSKSGRSVGLSARRPDRFRCLVLPSRTTQNERSCSTNPPIQHYQRSKHHPILNLPLIQPPQQRAGLGPCPCPCPCSERHHRLVVRQAINAPSSQSVCTRRARAVPGTAAAGEEMTNSRTHAGRPARCRRSSASRRGRTARRSRLSRLPRAGAPRGWRVGI
jgi:hypothetical protein